MIARSSSLVAWPSAHRVQHPDHRHRDAVDVDRLADRVPAPNSLVAVSGRAPPRAAAGHVGGGDEPPSAMAAVRVRQPAAGWCRPRVVVQFVRCRRSATPTRGRLGATAAMSGATVLLASAAASARSGWRRSRAGRTPAQPVELPGETISRLVPSEVIAAGPVAGALAEADGEDDGGDADQDPEHRERRAQPVERHRCQARCAGSRTSSSGPPGAAESRRSGRPDPDGAPARRRRRRRG